MKSKILLPMIMVSVMFTAVACNKQPQRDTAKPAMSPSEEGSEMDQKKDKAMVEKMKGEKMPTSSADKTDQGGSMMEKPGRYQDYSAGAVSVEQKAGHKVVLFFYAPWCPFCRAADADFQAHGDKIPAGVTVLKTSYDNETTLKQKYGVTYQHTFVQIDSSGNLVTKWISGDTDLLAKNVK